MLAGYMDKFEEQLRIRLPDLASHFEVKLCTSVEVCKGQAA